LFPNNQTRQSTTPNNRQLKAHRKKQVLLKKDSSLNRDSTFSDNKPSEVEMKSVESAAEVPVTDQEKEGEKQDPSNVIVLKRKNTEGTNQSW